MKEMNPQQQYTIKSLLRRYLQKSDEISEYKPVGSRQSMHHFDGDIRSGLILDTLSVEISGNQWLQKFSVKRNGNTR